MKQALRFLLAIVWSALPAFAEVRDVVILYTNDLHSAIDPIPA
jgi:2',3'-cyclic-nucleotide 2'-phosphodiesterase (5'-nucleotidase family)